MTIDEAIKMLEDYNPEEEYDDYSKFWPALQLAIEALKREKYYREHEPDHLVGLLPGEAEE